MINESKYTSNDFLPCSQTKEKISTLQDEMISEKRLNNNKQKYEYRTYATRKIRKQAAD